MSYNNINIFADVEFYSTGQMGRTNPIDNGYRTSIVMGINEDTYLEKGYITEMTLKNSVNSSGTFDLQDNQFTFNKAISVKISFYYFNTKIIQYLTKNEYFLIIEGPRIIGHGVFTTEKF